jgi:hypothetical protein
VTEQVVRRVPRGGTYYPVGRLRIAVPPPSRTPPVQDRSGHDVIPRLGRRRRWTWTGVGREERDNIRPLVLHELRHGQTSQGRSGWETSSLLIPAPSPYRAVDRKSESERDYKRHVREKRIENLGDPPGSGPDRNGVVSASAVVPAMAVGRLEVDGSTWTCRT